MRLSTLFSWVGIGAFGWFVLAQRKASAAPKPAPKPPPGPPPAPADLVSNPQSAFDRFGWALALKNRAHDHPGTWIWDSWNGWLAAAIWLPEWDPEDLELWLRLQAGPLDQAAYNEGVAIADAFEYPYADPEHVRHFEATGPGAPVTGWWRFYTVDRPALPF